MARQSTFNISIDTGQLDSLVEGLSQVTPEALGARLVDVTNEQIESAYDLSRKRMLSGINLTDGYVQSRFELRKASNTRASADLIAAARGKKDLTLLSHYGVNMRTVPVKDKARSKGRPDWGIPKGEKQGAPTVSVVAPKVVKSNNIFVLPTKKDSEGNPFIVRRLGNRRTKNNKSKLEVLKGPSVYQLFRVAIGDLEEQIGDDYQAAITDAAEKELLKVLG